MSAILFKVQKKTIQDLVLIAAFAALIIALGAVAVPIGGLGIPIVLQNMGVALAAMVLGARRGTFAVVLYLGVGLIGVPNLSGFRSTLSALAGPSIGYLIGYILAALVIGLMTQRRPLKAGGQIALFITAGLVGVAIQYLLGSVGLVYRADMNFIPALVSNGAFIPGDIIKVVIAALIAVPVLRALPDLRPRKTPSKKPKQTSTDAAATPAS